MNDGTGSAGTWAQRANVVTELLAELAELLVVSRDDETDESIVNRALSLASCRERSGQGESVEVTIRSILMAVSISELGTTLETLCATILSLDDFEALSTLSTPGPFARVELVRPRNGIERVDTGGLYVMKTLERRWGYRMRSVRPLLPPHPRHTDTQRLAATIITY